MSEDFYAAEVTRLRAERDWLIANLDEVGHANFRTLAQTREQAIAEMGEQRYSALLAAAYGRDTCATCGHHRDSHYDSRGACRVLDSSAYAIRFAHGMCACHEYVPGGTR
jgi:hypothetical protein